MTESNNGLLKVYGRFMFVFRLSHYSSTSRLVACTSGSFQCPIAVVCSANQDHGSAACVCVGDVKAVSIHTSAVFQFQSMVRDVLLPTFELPQMSK